MTQPNCESAIDLINRMLRWFEDGAAKPQGLTQVACDDRAEQIRSWLERVQPEPASVEPQVEPTITFDSGNCRCDCNPYCDCPCHEEKVAADSVSHPPLEQEAAKLAQFFHETYERLAPDFGYVTRQESAVPWKLVPERNKNLMVAVCKEVLAAFVRERSNRA